MSVARWLPLGVLCLLAAAVSEAQTTPVSRLPTPQIMSHGRFEKLNVYRPVGAVRQVILMLSGAAGWQGEVMAMAGVLAADGALVVGIDTAALLQNLEQDGGDCVFPDGDLENLSHFVQAYYQLPDYKVPLLVGYSAGASMAYAVLAQAPPQIFAGALSIGFCIDMKLLKPLCQGEGVHFTRRDRRGVVLLPATTLAAPWVALHGAFDKVCGAKAAQRFASRVAGSEFILLPNVGHRYKERADWLPQLRTAMAHLHARQPPAPLSVPKNLGDLPIIEVNSVGAGDQFAVLLSGDGGWAGLDKAVADALAAHGIPVVGVDSLRYFWSARTPAGTASDIDRIVRYYLAHWQKRNVILIGYSQGADVLPFVVNRLPEDTKKIVRLTVLLGLGTNATFEFHLSNWIDDDDGGEPIRPEIDKFAGLRALCLYGEDDESLCPQLASATVKVEKIAGGHHFDGEYAAVATLIMKYALQR